MTYSDLIEGRRYTIRYGADEDWADFDESVFVGYALTNDEEEPRLAFQRAKSAPLPLLFDPMQVVSITLED